VKKSKRILFLMLCTILSISMLISFTACLEEPRTLNRVYFWQTTENPAHINSLIEQTSNNNIVDNRIVVNIRFLSQINSLMFIREAVEIAFSPMLYRDDQRIARLERVTTSNLTINQLQALEFFVFDNSQPYNIRIVNIAVVKYSFEFSNRPN